MAETGQQSLEQRILGLERQGDVFLRPFDEGIVVTLGAKIVDDNYYLTLPSVSTPPGLPGIPVTFAYPEDVFEKHVIPAIIVRRDDISADMQRWHPGKEHWKVPGEGSLQVGSPIPNDPRVSWDRSETKYQSEPVDIMYTISILARHRQGIGLRREVNEILKKVLSVYQVYGRVIVKDSLGDSRTYEAFREGISVLDDLSDVAGRMVGFAVTVRVEAEFDLVAPRTSRTVTALPVLTVEQLGS